MSRFLTHADDDYSLAQLLIAETRKPSIAPYRLFVCHVLDVTGLALSDGALASTLSVELEYAYVALQDNVRPVDPRDFADALYDIVTWAVETSAPAADLQAKIDALLDGL